MGCILYLRAIQPGRKLHLVAAACERVVGWNLSAFLTRCKSVGRVPCTSWGRCIFWRGFRLFMRKCCWFLYCSCSSRLLAWWPCRTSCWLLYCSVAVLVPLSLSRLRVSHKPWEKVQCYTQHLLRGTVFQILLHQCDCARLPLRARSHITPQSQQTTTNCVHTRPHASVSQQHQPRTLNHNYNSPSHTRTSATKRM